MDVCHYQDRFGRLAVRGDRQGRGLRGTLCAEITVSIKFLGCIPGEAACPGVHRITRAKR
jgi:hypothetical protein